MSSSAITVTRPLPSVAEDAGRHAAVGRPTWLPAGVVVREQPEGGRHHSDPHPDNLREMMARVQASRLRRAGFQQ